jgi:site-specific DNA-methyltransferase (adenine-specific)
MGEHMIDLRQGDCRIVLADVMPDVLICDPPYSEHVHKSATSCGTPGARPSLAAKGAAHRDLGFEHLGEDLMAWTCALAAKTRRWSVIFTDTESVGLWQRGFEAAGATYIRAVPWVRWSMPQLSGDRPPQGHEMVVLAWGSAKGKKSWNGPGNLTHLSHTCMRGAGKHKAQKPLDLMLDLVEYFSNGPVNTYGQGIDDATPLTTPGELIVDPYMGSGTTAMACAALGRNFIGCEQDESWVEKTKRRLHADELWYDDEERYAKYLVASKARQEDMARMAKNTARIVANRKAQTDG